MKLILSILLSLLSLNLFAADGALGTASGTTTVGTIPAGNLPALGVAYPAALTNNSTVAWTNTDNITALTFSGAGSGQGILQLSNAAATGLTVILGPSNAFANVAYFSNSIVAPHWKDPTNAPTSNDVVTATSTSGDTAWKAASGGAQTPWTSDINGGGFRLTNAIPPLVSPNGFIMPSHLGQRVLVAEDIEQQSLSTAPATLAFENNGTGTLAVGVTDNDSNHIGLIVLNCSTNVSAYSALSGRADSIVMSTADWYVEWAFRFTNTDTTMALSNGWVKVGLIEGRIDIANQAAGMWAQLENTTNVWKLVTANNSTKTTNITSTVGWVNTWQTIGLFSPWPNTNAILYVNGSPIATNTANLPSGAAHPTTLRMGAGASAAGLGTSTLGMFVDYVWLAFSPNTWP